MPYKFVITQKTEERTAEDIKAKWVAAMKGKRNQHSVLDAIADALKQDIKTTFIKKKLKKNSISSGSNKAISSSSNSHRHSSKRSFVNRLQIIYNLEQFLIGIASDRSLRGIQIQVYFEIFPYPFWVNKKCYICTMYVQCKMYIVH